MIWDQVNPSRLGGVRAWSGALAVSLLLFALIPLLSRPQPCHPEPYGVGANLAPLIIERTETASRAEGLRPAHPWQREPVRELEESVARPAAALEAQASRPEPQAAEPITKAAIKRAVKAAEAIKSQSEPAPVTGTSSPTASSGASEAGNTTTGPVGEPDGEAEKGSGTGATGLSAGAATSGTGQADRKPTAIRAPRPKYPETARRRGLEGWVRVRFKVDDQGRVCDVTVVQASPEGVFDRTVLQTLPNWRFRPGSREGRPMATWVETTIKFTLVDG